LTPQNNDSQRRSATIVEPLIEELTTAPPPIEAFRRFSSLPWTLFLDSAASDDTHGRFSYLAASPVRTLVARKRSVTISDAVTNDLENREYLTRSTTEADPFDTLDDELSRWSARVVPGVPPFQGGAAGLLGYGLCHVVERIAAARHDEFRVPDLAVGLYDWVLAWDHVKSTCHLISLGIPATDADERAALAARRARHVKERLAQPVDNVGSPERLGDEIAASRLAPSWEVPGKSGLLSNFSKDDYIRAVARSIEYIHAGDVFQVNLSQRLLYPLRCSVVDFYLTLRKANPAPFAGYFDTGEHVVASSSPEQFLSLEGEDVITRPIKGTRSRGYTAEEDVYRSLDLRESEKDRAENVMIVDLLRNDLSRVCRPHTVQVPRLFDLERHPTVHHLVSEVRGKLREDVGAIDLVRASFPGGSITGAPKVRAMEIIAELEPTARGPYCGSLAWVALHGGMGSNILIRTVTAGQGWLRFPVGGGIVADSRPQAEYQETLDKAAGMVRALS
jgi:para-aminobenzoate synthetase component 1